MKKFDTWLLFLYYNAMITSEDNVRITVRIDCYISGKQAERGRFYPRLHLLAPTQAMSWCSVDIRTALSITSPTGLYGTRNSLVLDQIGVEGGQRR